MATLDSCVLETLRRQIRAVEQRIAAACARAGRKRSDVRLVAVTKTLPDALIPALPGVGLNLLAENRPQQLWRRHELVAGQAQWHMIGHLQRNKVERTLPLVELIHSVDSIRLLQAIDEVAAAQKRTAAVLLEVNTSGEASKTGFSMHDATQVGDAIRELHAVHVQGLMTMAPLEEDPERCRPCFVQLRELRDRLASASGDPHSFAELSMGMSNDFEVAIEEGATLVRIGSALFAGIEAVRNHE